MEYAALVEVYRDLETTRSTLRKRDLLVGLFEDVDAELLPAIVRLVRGRVFAPSESRELGVASSLALEAVVTATGVDADRIETWWREEGDLGSAASKALAHRRQRALVSDPLEVSRVYDTLRRMATFRGEGSQSRLVETLAGLISDADPEEATYLVRTVLGALRIGVGDGLVRDAIAHAFLDGDDDVDAVERAYAVTNDFALVAERARVVGRAGRGLLPAVLDARGDMGRGRAGSPGHHHTPGWANVKKRSAGR